MTTLPTDQPATACARVVGRTTQQERADNHGCATGKDHIPAAETLAEGEEREEGPGGGAADVVDGDDDALQRGVQAVDGGADEARHDALVVAEEEKKALKACRYSVLSNFGNRTN